jgi:hypothetical protein
MAIGPRGVELTQGEAVTLFSLAARDTAAAAATGTAVYLGGERRRFVWVLKLTNAGNANADTLDVFVDWSLDNTIWLNGVHFTQILGDGTDALTYYTVCDPTGGLTADVAITSDAAANTTRPTLFGPYVRGRYALVNGGGTHTFTFSLTGYAQ